MSIVLGANQYGKAENRVVRIYRDTDRHEIRDLNVSTSLRGDFADAHVTGDQAKILPTDTQKNTAFAYAKEHGVTSPEDYAIALGTHFLDAAPPATGAQIGVEEYAWDRIQVDGSGHDHSFVRRGTETRTAWSPSRVGRRRAGLGGLRVQRPRRAQVDRLGVQGLPQGQVHDAPGDRRPDPGHVADRRAGATRAPRPTRDTDWDASYEDIKRTLMAAFATTYSRALQETLYAMGRAVLEAHPEVAEIKFSAPNKHHFLVDLAPFGLKNNGEVFIAADRPYGLIEAAVSRDDASDPGLAWQAVPGFV